MKVMAVIGVIVWTAGCAEPGGSREVPVYSYGSRVETTPQPEQPAPTPRYDPDMWRVIGEALNKAEQKPASTSTGHFRFRVNQHRLTPLTSGTTQATALAEFKSCKTFLPAMRKKSEVETPGGSWDIYLLNGSRVVESASIESPVLEVGEHMPFPDDGEFRVVLFYAFSADLGMVTEGEARSFFDYARAHSLKGDNPHTFTSVTLIKDGHPIDTQPYPPKDSSMWE